MSGEEIFNGFIQQGTPTLRRVVVLCQVTGPYCLIGGLAVNCYVDPVYTEDADLVLNATNLELLRSKLIVDGFTLEEFPYSLNASLKESRLRIQFTKDPFYDDFPQRAVERIVFGEPILVACLEDVLKGKIKAFQTKERCSSKRAKDQSDIIRIVESYPEFLPMIPASIQEFMCL